MSAKSFEKKHGFVAPPIAHLSGTWEAFKTCVIARLKCSDCGAEVNIRFRGNPDTMSHDGISRWVLARAQQKHQCLAVDGLLSLKPKRYFADLLRGREKLHELERKLLIGGYLGKPTPRA